MADPTLLQEVIEIAQEGLARPRSLWQLLVIAVGLVVGALVARHVRKRVDAQVAAERLGGRFGIDLLRFSVAGMRRLAFPVTAFLTMVVGGLLLRASGMVLRVGDVQLLRVALTLLAALAVIRLLVYVVRRSLPSATWLVSFERWIALLVWMVVALYLTGLLGDVITALDSVRFPVGRSQISLWDLLIGAVSVIFTVVAALWVGSSVESRLMRAESLTTNSRVVLVRVVKAVLLFVAVLVALSTVGIDLTVLSVFGGALGVGLGLGLQRIASNYVAGFIILLDRSLSIGDMITVDKYYGRVAQINTRYTLIKALDGTETIVPNEMLVSTPVVNHSLTSREVRVVVKLAISYASDLDRALQILNDCAREQPRVLAAPEPGAFMTGFGADGVELELGFWIRDPEEGTLAVRSGISRSALKRFAAAGIEIPFPRRDVRVIADEGGGAPLRRGDPPGGARPGVEGS
ncbi:MAG TPA: mechanosensitive ion channel domain-containing protein [Burkholderiaceae bacterium]|nr:mechanosensitive ion channel domain-containing protein [Burkholderiaceae bacterium]